MDDRLNARQRRWLKRHGDLNGYKSPTEKHDKRLTVTKLITRKRIEEPPNETEGSHSQT
jgi:hypothetical protein